MVCNGDALLKASRNPSIRVAIPKEGAPLWIDSLAVSRDAPQPELAHRLIGYLTSPDNSAKISNHLHFATPNLLARAKVDPRLLGNPVLYPDPATMERCTFIKFPGDLEKTIHQAVVRLVSGGRSRATVAENGNPETGLVEQRGERNFTTED